MRLAGEAVRRYHEEGFVSPIRVLSADEADGYRGKLEAIEASGRLPAGALRCTSRITRPSSLAA